MSFFLLHPREVESVRKQKCALVVDLRSCEEYQKYHYRNAVSMPYSDCEKWLEWFHKGRNYILYCDYGNVSLLVARKLAQKDITVYSVIGGAKELRRVSDCCL